jgi:hypothetical protein
MKGSYFFAIIGVQVLNMPFKTARSAAAGCVPMDFYESLLDMQGPKVRDTTAMWKLPWTMV